MHIGQQQPFWHPVHRIVRRVLLPVVLLGLCLVGAGVVRRWSHSFPTGVDPAGAAHQAATALDHDSPQALPRHTSRGHAAFPAGVTDLAQELEVIRARHLVPALGLAIVRGDSLCALGVVGVRRAGADAPAQWDDRFHIGSNTKAMTATVVALLIEEGRLDWSTTLAEVFPDLAAGMQPEYRVVTIEMLLQHRAGLRDDRFDKPFRRRLGRLRGPWMVQRREATKLALKRPPAYPPGTSNVYANASFDILGSVIEQVTGSTWETNMAERLFDPLGMRSAGFGAPSTPGQLDQPWGHAVPYRRARRLFWVDRGWLPVAQAPSGDVSLSMSDWARFAALHLQAGSGRYRLLSPASFQRLHRETLPESSFASGWGVAREDSLGVLLEHVGSDGWWMAMIVLAPQRGVAFLAATNAGDASGEAACNDALRLGRRWSQPGA